ncbi:alpha/beta hydrolase [Sulfuriferula sp.]|uniref:alpha/beta hydrolase n=1 Tax=Sulfuriferula sp. TaxID=2025307 RepID=UPI002730DBB8|nr:CocE/NonD family hydrolase [Sulfuriferula sp.]MDP2025324.1 alpha/beta hydrolase [Sulfuriferula sp.]
MKRAKLRIKTAIGNIETLVNDPGSERRGLAFIAHPHPLHGGTLDNKVVQTLAQTCHDEGYVAVRPNFRGVGGSDGEYDSGLGETDDMLAVIAFVRAQYAAPLPLILAGFSFGAYVQHRVAQRIAHDKLILIGPAVNMYGFDAVPAHTHVIHGEHDELVPLAAAQAWAQASGAQLSVIHDTGHFFHGKLAELKAAALAACHS